MTAYRIHPSAILEEGVSIGEGTSVWDNVHIRKGAIVGKNCIVGEKTYIAYGVWIGDFVKINAMVYICAGVTIEDFVMISAGCVFTNDLLPRAGNVRLTGLETSDPTESTLPTTVRRGATLGANSTIGPGIEIGEFAMIGMGSVVTSPVDPHRLVYGNPARGAGYVCVCGKVFLRDASLKGRQMKKRYSCKSCGREFQLSHGKLTLLPD